MIENFWFGQDILIGKVIFSFAEKEWRLQQREYANTQTSWPRNGNILQTDDVSMHGAYDVCVKRLKDLREKGYDYPSYIDFYQ